MARYRKFLTEFKDLRREHEKLQEEYKRLQSQTILKTDEDLSLDLSTL
jgi:cell division protein FtsL